MVGLANPTLPTLLARYTGLLATAPLATNSVTAAGLSVVADGIAQSVERSGSAVAAASSWDFERSAWMAVWGAVVSGAALFYWFALLTRLWPGARTSWAQLVGKVCTNQIFISPVLNGGFFAFIILTRVAPKLTFGLDKRRELMRKVCACVVYVVCVSCVCLTSAPTSASIRTTPYHQYRADLLATCLRSTAFW